MFRRWLMRIVPAIAMRGNIPAMSRIRALTLADLDERLLERARQGAGLSALTDEEYLLKRKLADRRGRGIVLRNAAELLARYGPDHPNAGVGEGDYWLWLSDDTELSTSSIPRMRRLSRRIGWRIACSN